MLETVVSVLCSLCYYSSVAGIIFWFWFQWSHRQLLDTAANIPIIFQTVPLLGHVYLGLWGVEELGNYALERAMRALANGTKTICYWIGPVPLITIQDIDDLQIVLSGSNSIADKSDEYEFFVTGMDSGDTGPFRSSILTAKGAVWKVTRKHLNPMFHPLNVKQLVPVFNANSRELVGRITHHVGQGPFNVMDYTMEVGLKTICNLIFGPKVDIDLNSKSFKGLMNLVETIPQLFIRRLLTPWLRFGAVFRFLYRSQINELSRHWKNFTETPLKISRELQKQKKPRENIFNINELNENSATEDDQEPINFIDVSTILQQNYPEFTDADLRYEMITLYCTGTDTVGSGAASCLLALAQYQDIQDRLYHEISSVVGPDDDVSLEDLSRMPYLEMVLKETLRRFYIVPFVIRKLTKDVPLSEGTMPAGTPIFCTLAGIHMDPKLYPDPWKFDPDRFAPENSSGKEKFSFIPFSGGPRVCIAKTYAMQLIKIMLVHVVRKFKLTTTQDIHNLKKKLIVTLISSEGYNISLEPRIPNNFSESD